MKTYYSKWIPESPIVKGFYAIENPRQRIKMKGLEYGTYNIDESIRFDTREQCLEWINGQKLQWTPVSHGFYE